MMPWTPIRTMRRGQRPDFTPLRQPGNNYVTPAQQWFLDQLLDLEPGSEDVDGGGYAHKPGYHDTVAHNDARAGRGQDYSARDPQDRRGPHDKTRGRDWTFRNAQRGDYGPFARYGDRVLAAYRAGDPRLAGWREYLGRVSKSITVGGRATRRVGMDFRYRFLRIPDSSHDWHGHFSEDTAEVESFANKWAMLTVLAGWSVADWRASLPDTRGDDDVSAADVWGYDPNSRDDKGAIRNRPWRPDAKTNPTVAPRWAVEDTWDHVHRIEQEQLAARTRQAAVLAEVAGLRTAVESLAAAVGSSTGVDPAALREAVDQAVSGALARAARAEADALAAGQAGT